MLSGEMIALKEWAVAVSALQQGQQIIMMRKGGIREETKHFQIQSNSFYLFPTYEHQKRDLIKPEYHPLLDHTLLEWNAGDQEVSIACYAELVEDIEVFDQEQLMRLQPFHIWTEHFAEERLKWKKQQPLHLMLLRVYRLDQPVKIPILPQYLGCKSWIQLENVLSNIERIPVLSDSEFEAAAKKIKQALAAV